MRNVLILLILGLFYACSEKEGREVASPGEATATGVMPHAADISAYLPAIPKAYPVDMQNATGQQVKKWLEALLDDDQKYREMLHQSPNQDDRQTVKMMRQQDSLNQVILSVILQKYG